MYSFISSIDGKTHAGAKTECVRAVREKAVAPKAPPRDSSAFKLKERAVRHSIAGGVHDDRGVPSLSSIHQLPSERFQ